MCLDLVCQSVILFQGLQKSYCWKSISLMRKLMKIFSVPFYDMNSLIQLPLSVVMQSAVLNSFNGEELLGEDGLFGEVFFGLNAS